MTVSLRIIDRVLAYGAGVSGALLLGAAVFVPPLTSGITAGASLAFFNIYGSRVLLPRTVRSQKVSPLYGALLVLKFASGLALVAVFTFVLKVNLVGLVLGFGGFLFSGVGFALVHETMRAPAADPL